MPRNPMMLAALAGQAHAIHPVKGEAIVSVLASRADVDVRVNVAGIDWENDRVERMNRGDAKHPYRVVSGVAIIPIEDTLMHRWEALRPESGATGYDGLRVNLRAAADDRRVKGIMLDVNSPGGHVPGCAEIADLVFEVRQAKPVVAMVDWMAFSAAYWIASQASEIIAVQDGGVGSIGALWMHIAQGRALDAEGLDVTFVHAGSHKVDGNPIEALPEDVRGAVQAELEDIRGRFAAAVGRGRGARFSAEAAMETEADDFTALEAVEMGLIDRIEAPDAAFAAFVNKVGTSSTGFIGGGSMSDPNEPGGQPDQNVASAVQAALANAAAISRAAREAALPELGDALAAAQLDKETALAVIAAAKADRDTAVGAVEGELEQATADLQVATDALNEAKASGETGLLAKHMKAAGDPDVAPTGGDAEVTPLFSETDKAGLAVAMRA